MDFLAHIWYTCFYKTSVISGDTMLDIYTVSLFGHREISYDPELETKLEQTFVRLLQTHSYVSFLVGREGEFDLFAAGIIHRIRENWGDHNSELVWVMPYLKQEYVNNADAYDNFYSHVEVCEESDSAHFKAAIGIRNRHMIDRSDLVIAYLRHHTGGVAKAVGYAKQQYIPVLEL